jgi:hypothetical protein
MSFNQCVARRLHCWTTFYYYKGLIIDTGCPLTAEEAANFMEEKKLNVKVILLTLYHEDHRGGAGLFKKDSMLMFLLPSYPIGFLQILALVGHGVRSWADSCKGFCRGTEKSAFDGENELRRMV